MKFAAILCYDFKCFTGMNPVFEQKTVLKKCNNFKVLKLIQPNLKQACLKIPNKVLLNIVAKNVACAIC